jgi:uncharacterized phage protein (TIGR01671 family)
MNRQVEFRGHDEACGLWRYGSLLVDGWLTYIGQFIQGKIVRWRVNPTSVGQYTGLKDKNGVEIYEGDIVVVTNLMVDGFGEQMLASIVYDEELACFDFKASDRQRCVCTTILDVELEVIGNIHDNPELLKEDERK